MPGSSDPIGVAKMKHDGTIVLQLRATDAGGAIGDALITYREGEEHYDEILRHIGGIAPGEVKIVPPWPSEPGGR